jgi:hypothetical protein
MKFLITLFLFLSPLLFKAQDGLYTFFDGERERDTLISFFNSDTDALNLIANRVITSIIKNEMSEGPFTLRFEEGATVDGCLYVTKKWSHVSFDFYIRRILYDSGYIYHATRFEEPKE